MTLKKLKELCNKANEIASKAIKTNIVDKIIFLSESNTIDGYKAEIEEYSKEYNFCADTILIEYISEDYGISDGGIGIVVQVELEKTESSFIAEINRRFESSLWKLVYSELTHLGYKRCGYNSRLFKEFDDTTLYKMYKDGEFDRLLKYYLLRFNKLNE